MRRRDGQGGADPQRHAEGERAHASREDLAENVRGLGSERHADAQFPGAGGDLSAQDPEESQAARTRATAAKVPRTKTVKRRRGGTVQDAGHGLQEVEG